MKRLRLLWHILKMTGAHKIMLGFVGFLFLSAAIFTILEPGITHYGDGIWYCFAVFTTIGFGDMVAVTTLGRLLTILLGLYGLFIVALIPGIVVNYFTEISKRSLNQSIVDILDQLEHLPDLSKEELEQLSASIRRNRV